MYIDSYRDISLLQKRFEKEHIINQLNVKLSYLKKIFYTFYYAIFFFCTFFAGDGERSGTYYK